MSLDSAQGILEFAIGREEAAAQFYADLAEKVKNPWMKQTFIDFSKEELGHRDKLLLVQGGGAALRLGEKVADLKIAEYVTDIEPTPDMDYTEALVLAMKAEKLAFKLYTDLAAVAECAEARDLFLALAQEEAKHKLRFELEYDETVHEEN